MGNQEEVKLVRLHVSVRYHAVGLIEGSKTQEVSRMIGVSTRTIRRWIWRYDEGRESL